MTSPLLLGSVRPAAAVTDAPGAAVELMPTFLYGHSYLASDLMNTPGARYMDKVKARLNLGTMTNRAVSGNQVFQVANDILGNTGARLWTFGTKGLVILETGGAEPLTQDMTDPKVLGSIRYNLRAALLALGGATRIEASTFTQVGTWSDGANAAYSNGNVRQTSTQGDYAEVTVTGDKATIIVSSLDTGFFGSRLIEVKVDGVVWPGMAALDVDDKVLPLQATVSKYPIEITGMGSGSHTIRLTAGAVGGGSGTSYMALDVAFVPTPTPPTVVVVRERLTSLTTQAELDALNGQIDLAMAGLDYVSACNLMDGFNYATMVGSDGNHPNDHGTGHHADVVAAHLRSLPFRNGLNTLTTP